MPEIKYVHIIESHGATAFQRWSYVRTTIVQDGKLKNIISDVSAPSSLINLRTGCCDTVSRAVKHILHEVGHYEDETVRLFIKAANRNLDPNTKEVEDRSDRFSIDQYQKINAVWGLKK